MAEAGVLKKNAKSYARRLPIVCRQEPKIVNPCYVFYYCRSGFYQDWILKRKRTLAQPNINGNEYGTLEIPLPPLSEQRRIVEILDQADALRKKRAQADAKASRILQSIFLKMFGDVSTNSMGWEIMSIGDVTSLVTSGLTPHGGSVNYVDKGPYFLRSQNIRMNHLDLSDIACLPIEVHERMARTKVKQGDVLLNITGASIGRVAWYDISEHEANVNQHVCIIRLVDKACPEYISYILSTPYGQMLIDRAQTGATRQGLNHENIRRISLPIPKISEQRNFASIVRDYQQLRSKCIREKSKFSALFENILHRAFSGDLTAKWREAHMKELLGEMEQQTKLLTKVAT